MGVYVVANNETEETGTIRFQLLPCPTTATGAGRRSTVQNKPGIGQWEQTQYVCLKARPYDSPLSKPEWLSMILPWWQNWEDKVLFTPNLHHAKERRSLKYRSCVKTKVELMSLADKEPCCRGCRASTLYIYFLSDNLKISASHPIVMPEKWF